MARERNDVMTMTKRFHVALEYSLVGRLRKIEITKLAANTPADDKALVFISNHVSGGIATADSMLDFRFKASPISQKERQ